ncbi:MAG: glycosyltransferase family 39 protein [Acidobacteria bacterium]|nr:glycosyltransferase family 39 protein [Acidobacteriota bacterium]
MVDEGIVLAVPAALAVSCAGPGLLLLRRARLRPDETIVAGIVLSLLLLYLSSFAVFALGIGRAAHYAILAICVALTVAAAPDIRSLVRSPDVRALLGGLGLVLVWVVSLLALIRNYSGATWYGDWLEHYRRTEFFLGGHPPGETFLDYPLPARPPLVNVLCAHFLALFRDRFRVYQLTSSLLSLLAFLPAALLARQFAPRGRRVAGIVGAFLICSPMFVQNATYAWTKLPAVFFVLAGLHFYLTGVRSGEFARIFLSFAALAAGVLTHYSAVPYAVFLGFHWLFGVVPRSSRRLRDLVAVCGTSVVLMVSWFGWSAAVYGVRPTLTAASTAPDGSTLGAGDLAATTVRVLFETLVPPIVRNVPRDPLREGLTWGSLRDAAFAHYQMNLPLALGLLGAPLLLYCLWRAYRERRAATAPGQPAVPAPAGVVGAAEGPGAREMGSSFWILFVVFNLVAGSALTAATSRGVEAPLGLAQLQMQPLVLLAVAFLASRFGGWSRPVKWVAIGGLLVDLLLGIALHLWFESAPLDGLERASRFWPSPSDLRIGTTMDNLILQVQHGTVFLGSHLRKWAWLAALLAGAALSVTLVSLVREARMDCPARS